MYSVTAHFSKNAPASAANVNARRLRKTGIDTARVSPRGRHLWICGVPAAPNRDLNQILDGAVEGDLADSIRSLTSLDGAFAAFIWDEPARKLVVITDFIGSQPLYIRRTPGSIAFAPTIRELAASAEPDPAGWGSFVGFGHFIAERTSVAGVHRVTPATILEFEPDTDRLTRRTYWQWPALAECTTEADLDTGEMLDLLRASIEAYDAYGARGTLLLSGGYESRLLVGLLDHARVRPSALTLRNPYEHLEIDGRFAARVARQVGMTHAVRDPDPDFFSTEKYLKYVTLSDVSTTSVNLFIAQVYAELQAANVEASWDGVCYGTVIKDKSAPSFDAFVQKALKPLDSPAWQAARSVFSAEFVNEMWTQLHATLADEIARCHEGPFGVAQFFIRNRARNRTTPNALKVYSNFLVPFMPGLTKAFYEAVVPIPPRFKTKDSLYRRILERHFPALARLPYCSGGHIFPGTQRDLRYRLLAARSAIVEHPRVGHLLRRLGVSPSRPESALVTNALNGVNLDNKVLNRDGIRALQRTPPSGRNDDTLARELVFYWTMWREVMSAGGLQRAARSSREAAGSEHLAASASNY